MKLLRENADTSTLLRTLQFRHPQLPVPLKTFKLSRDKNFVAGRAATMTHGYKRHGTTTLFAALELLEGEVIGECLPRHRSQEFVKFLNIIDKKTPPELDLYLIVDNYSTHKTPLKRRWLKRHKRFHCTLSPPVPRGST